MIVISVSSKTRTREHEDGRDGNYINRLPNVGQCGISTGALCRRRCDLWRRRKGDAMYVIRNGEVTIEHGGRVIETLGAGGIFGEMALIDGSVRSATVRAKTDCEMAPINEKTFLFVVHETPFFAIAVMRAFAGRLRHMNEPLAVAHAPFLAF